MGQAAQAEAATSEGDENHQTSYESSSISDAKTVWSLPLDLSVKVNCVLVILNARKLYFLDSYDAYNRYYHMLSPYFDISDDRNMGFMKNIRKGTKLTESAFSNSNLDYVFFDRPIINYGNEFCQATVANPSTYRFVQDADHVYNKRLDRIPGNDVSFVIFHANEYICSLFSQKALDVIDDKDMKALMLQLETFNSALRLVDNTYDIRLWITPMFTTAAYR